jgi:hypothetical protein
MDIKEIIKKDIKEKQNKYQGQKYYNYKPKNEEAKTVDVADSNGEIQTIVLEKKCELYTNYFKLLVDQKIDYILNKEPTIKSSLPYSINEISQMYEDLTLQAKLDGKCWLHFYYDEGKLNYVIVEDIEIIPIYKIKKLIGVIRYYFIDKETIYVEEWSFKGLKSYKIKKDQIIDITVSTHYQTEIKIENQVIETYNNNFNEIPFIVFENHQGKSDLEDVKVLIDYYNDISSGFIDNVYKFQEAIMKLKGFSGDVKTLEDTLKNLKKFKMVGIPDEKGDIEYMAIEIPVEARKFLLELLENNIYKIGKGYDSDQIGDGNITNVVIKSRYFSLDIHCNKIIKKIKLFHENFCRFLNVSNTDIEINKTQLFNESEKLTDCVNAIDLYLNGLLSKETLIKNIPFVDNIDEEKLLILKDDVEKLKKQKQENDMLIGQNQVKNDNTDKTGQNEEE